jgi:hypothetical protein
MSHKAATVAETKKARYRLLTANDKGVCCEKKPEVALLLEQISKYRNR